jgi:MYXO-CTERM domain-containing protein
MESIVLSSTRPSRKRVAPKRALYAALVAAGSLFATSPARAQSCNVEQTVPLCTSCVNTNARFVNVYWSANWDGNAPAGSGLTMQAIDDFTRALLDSTYFQTAASDYGTGTPTFGGSVQDDSIAVAPGQVGIPYMSMEVNHARTASFGALSNVVVNLFVPAGTLPIDLDLSSCSSFSAFHTAADYLGTSFTVIPVDPSCNHGFDDIAQALSHEMVELITDPGGTGFHFLKQYPGGEVADVCQDGIPGIVARTAPVPFLLDHVDPYFSNASCSCIPGWTGTTSTFDPLILSLAADGSLQMQMNGSLGTFGNFPADFGAPSATSPTTRNTPYLSLTATNGSTTASAGNSIRNGGDSQVVQISQWSGNQVRASVPVSFVDACDTLALTAWNPSGGTAAVAHAVYGSAASVTLGSSAVGVAGVAQTVHGVVRDANQIPVAGANVVVSINGVETTVSTGANGEYVISFTPAVSGTVTLVATTVDCASATVTSNTVMVDVLAGGTQCAVSSAPGARTQGSALLGALMALAALTAARRRRAA